MAQTDETSGRPMDAVFEAEPRPRLLCGRCHAEIDDDVNDCPACLTPVNWASSNAALKAYWAATGG